MRAPLPALVPAAALAREWLLRNDRGAVASGTAAGVHVRLRHAPLATTAADGRLVPLLLRLDARAGAGHPVFELTWRPHDARAQPPARALIEAFSGEPWPTWRYRVGDTTLEREQLLVRDHAALVSIWRHVDGPPVRLAVTPALAADDAAPAGPLADESRPDETPEAGGDGPERLDVQAIPGRVRFSSGGTHRLTLWHDGAFLPVRSWRRGRDGGADAASWLMPVVRGDVPGFVEATLGPGGALHLVIAAEEALLRRLAQLDRLGTPPPRTLAGCVAAIVADERRLIETRTRGAMAAAGATAREAWGARHADETPPVHPLEPDDPWVARLARGLDLCAAPARGPLAPSAPFIEAGAIEALRAVRGLVALKRHEPAEQILLTLGQLVREGLVPSGFDPGGAPRYESPEASLWFVLAAELFARRAGEYEFVRHSLWQPLEQVFDRFRSGTRLGIRLRDDGLLGSGEDGAARTDLNALWYSALGAMGQLARAVGQKQSGALYLAWAHEHQARFNELMWDEPLDAPWLALTPAGPVRGLEPSLVLAASLSPPLLHPERARALLAAIERELLTGAGLREAPGAPRIIPGWTAHFLGALVRAHGRGAAVQARARATLSELGAAIDSHAAGHVPEAFETGADLALDGAPLQISGAPVSLAGTAELLRFWVEDLDHAAALEAAPR